MIIVDDGWKLVSIGFNLGSLNYKDWKVNYDNQMTTIKTIKCP